MIPKVVPTAKWLEVRLRQREQELKDMTQSNKKLVREVLRYRKTLHRMGHIIGRTL